MFLLTKTTVTVLLSMAVAVPSFPRHVGEAASAVSRSEGNLPDSTRKSLIRLNWSEREVTGIASRIGGKAFCQRRATERNFKRNASKAGILHIATHCFVNDEHPMYSGLVLVPDSASGEDGFLNIYELVDMKLNADLAVLSACNTGTGKLVRGEGIMSLARGFMAAGCPSVLMSLWPIDDRATSEIMERYYTGLVEGRRKHEALRSAKIDFLKQADETRANPIYWAGMVQLGDTEPVRIRKKAEAGPWPFISAVILAGLCAGFLGKRGRVSAFRKKKRRSPDASP
jgi:CHAT domain-containing protein